MRVRMQSCSEGVVQQGERIMQRRLIRSQVTATSRGAYSSRVCYMCVREVQSNSDKRGRERCSTAEGEKERKRERQRANGGQREKRGRAQSGTK